MPGPVWVLEEASVVVALVVEVGGGAHKTSVVQTISVWAYGFRHI